jgi:hypothetical protein
LKLTKRRGITAVVAALTLTASGILIATQASANVTGSPFEGGDGNLIVDTAGNLDWANANPAVGVDLPTGQTDNSFGNGTKEDLTNVTVGLGSIPNNKADLTRQVAASQFIGGNLYLELGWVRASLSGTTNFDFEVNQAAQPDLTTPGPKTLNRTAGDLLVSFDFQGGSQKPTLAIRTWTGSAWGAPTPLANNGATAEAEVNRVVVDASSIGASSTLPAFEFGEAAINLTAAGVIPPGACEAFASFYTKSRASDSFTSAVKDFIAPTSFTVSNCATIVIHKVTENGDSTFGYSTTGGLSPSTFSLSNGGTQTYTGVTLGSKSVTENLTAQQIADGWTLKSLSCTATGSGTSVTTDLAAATASMTMAGGGLVDCTYTNHTKLSPTIATLLSANAVNIGDTVHDSATLTGATATAGGTVTYSAYAGANTCSGNALFTDQVTVTNAVVPNSGDYTTTAAGTISWQAVYSGDANNNGATSDCTTEQLVVAKNQPGASTAQDLLPNDHFTLSGGSNPTGSITFNLYDPSDATCSEQPAFTETVTVSGNGTYDTSNTTVHATSEGTWRWASTYSGDANNEAATSTCGTERFTIANS